MLSGGLINFLEALLQICPPRPRHLVDLPPAAMLDLNEPPEFASGLLVEADDPVVKTAASDAGVKLSKISLCGALPSSVLKDHDEASTITAEGRPTELLHSRSSLSSTLTSEYSIARQHSRSSNLREEDDTEKGCEDGVTANLLHKQELPFPQVVSQGKKDPADDALGGMHQFPNSSTTVSLINAHSSAQASTSRDHEDKIEIREANLQIPTALSFNKKTEPDNHDCRLKHNDDSPSSKGGSAICLSLGGVSSDGPAVCLSLGRISLQLQALGTRDSPHSCNMLKRSELLGLTLGRSDDRPPLSLRRNTDLLPFWNGKLHTDGPLLTPVDGYCLGVMKSDSCLKRLPSVLCSQQFLKLEEFVKSLLNGVTEPPAQFKPSKDASLEEVNRFNLMVEALSHGCGLSYSASLLGVDIGKKKVSTDGTFPYSAALISWEDVNYSVDAKLYLISLQCFQELVKNGQSNTPLGNLEEMDVLDPDSLYGIFCGKSPDHSKNRKQAPDHDAGRNKAGVTSSGRLESSLSNAPSLGERRKDAKRSSSPLPRGSPRVRNHSGHCDALVTSTLIETKRVSNRDLMPRSELGSPGRSSKRRLEKQCSSTDNAWDFRSKRSSRNNDDLHNDDIDMQAPQKLRIRQREKPSWTHGRHSERLDCRSDNNKDLPRSNKEDRNYGRQSIREHQRSTHHERDKASNSKSKEERRSHERASHKERDKSSRDKIAESLKTKLSEKESSQSKSSLVAHKTPSLDHESGRLSRKRESENKEKDAPLKRLRESEASVLASMSESAEQAGRNLKPEEFLIKQVDQEECLGQKCVEQADKSLSFELSKDFLHLNSFSFEPLVSAPVSDGTLEMMDKEKAFVKESTAIPSIINTSFDSIIEMNQDAIYGPICETEGVSEVDLNLLKASMMGTSWNGILRDSLVVKTEKEEDIKASLEISLDCSMDKETRTWLTSKQNAIYLHEEYGVDAEIITMATDGSKFDPGVKVDGHNGPLQVKISMATSESCDTAEAKWFVEQAASIIKEIAVRGVYVKCLWYEGPIQIHPGDGAPSVPIIVKKIKGEDGKNLERIQDETGVMIGVVLRKGGVSFVNEAENMSRPRFIGLRLKCIRRKGLLDASKEAEALLECVAEHFSKELATHIATHIADLQESAIHCCEVGESNDPSLSLALSTKELLPHSPVKIDSYVLKTPLGASSVADDSALVTLGDKSTVKLLGAASFTEELKVISAVDMEGRLRPLYVSNLPDHITQSKITSIIESVVREKLGSSGEIDVSSDIVVDVEHKSEKCCAFVDLASDRHLKAVLKLYAEDKTAFHGLCVEEGPLPFTRVERQGSCSKILSKNKVEHERSIILARSTDDDFARHQLRSSDNESDSDCSQDVWFADTATRTDYAPGKPRPLYLTELMRNASGPVIKQLFEHVINTYIVPALTNANGKQLVLDVRYVPTRGCAFVDLATPELVEFMLDLHARRPEVFLNMKMELGRRAGPYSTEDDGERRLSRSRDGKSQYGCRPSSLGSWKKLEKRASGAYIDYPDDSDKGEDFIRHISLSKKQRSDPEKTIYADRLPESASVGMITRIFERVLQQNLTREERDAIGDQLITEVRHVPLKYCAFVVFANEELTRIVLELYNQDEDIFECMRLKPHFHSRLEDLYKEDQETDELVRHPASLRERMVKSDADELVRLRESELHDFRSSRLAVQRAISATAFKEVDRRRSVYVDRIPEDLNELSMTQLFEKIFRQRKHTYEGHMVSQVAYFRDKFDPSKLCAFVEIKTEEGTQDLVDYYNDNQDAFHGMRVRPGFKYNT